MSKLYVYPFYDTSDRIKTQEMYFFVQLSGFFEKFAFFNAFLVTLRHKSIKKVYKLTASIKLFYRSLCMKKILATVALVFAGLCAFAEEKTWTNFLAVGCRLPTNTTITVKGEKEDSNIKFRNIAGLDTFYIGTNKYGFAVKGELNINAANSDIKISNRNNLIAMNVECTFGAGFAPLHDEHYFLAIFGTVGGTFFETEEIMKTSFEFSNAFVGADITTAYTFSNHFSIYGSLGAHFLLPGEVKVKNHNDDSYKKIDTKASWAFIPAFGMCWKF